MRYMTIPTISFTDSYGRTHAIKDMREYPTYTTMMMLDTKATDQIDEIATRQDVYGDGAEGDTYKIHEANIEKLFEEKWDMSKIKQLRIPVR